MMQLYLNPRKTVKIKITLPKETLLKLSNTTLVCVRVKMAAKVHTLDEKSYKAITPDYHSLFTDVSNEIVKRVRAGNIDRTEVKRLL